MSSRFTKATGTCPSAISRPTPPATRPSASRDVGTWGPLQRVAKVAHAWKLLAAQMERDGATTVRELEPATVVEHAERLWVTPPEGGLVEGIRG